MAERGLYVRFNGRDYADPQEGVNKVISELQNTWDAQIQTVREEMQAYLEHVAEVLARRHGEPWPEGTTDNSMSARTGRTMQSVLRSVKVTGTTWEALRGSIGGPKHLYIHEYGGIIRAKQKLLTIPLPAAMSTRGTKPPFARQWKNTFVGRSKRGNLLIFQRRGHEIVPLYVLKDKVVIPPRLGMRKTLEDELPYFITRATDRVVAEFNAQLGRN